MFLYILHKSNQDIAVEVWGLRVSDVDGLDVEEQLEMREAASKWSRPRLIVSRRKCQSCSVFSCSVLLFIYFLYLPAELLGNCAGQGVLSGLQILF